MTKMKLQVKELEEKNKTLNSKSDCINDELKSNEQKMNATQYNLNSMRKSLTDKEKVINIVKDKLTKLESFATEKDSIDKKFMEFHKQNDNLKREIE